MREINPENPLTDEARQEVAVLAARQSAASGVLMKAISFVGGQVEDGLRVLPKGARAQIDEAARKALQHSFNVAKASRSGALSQRLTSDRAHKAMAAISGALGGLGGLPTALAELPVATTVIFRAVLEVAESYGEDIHSEEGRMECLRVFSAGGPTEGDDGVDTTFVGARLSLSGTAISSLINKVAPRFAAMLSQKLATQAVPVLGAAAGAGTNYAFMSYYTEMAHVHFGLRKLARDYDDTQVLDAFHAALKPPARPFNRA